MSEFHSADINDDRDAVLRAAEAVKREVAIKDLRTKIAENAKAAKLAMSASGIRDNVVATTLSNAEVVLLDEYLSSLYKYLIHDMQRSSDAMHEIGRVLRGRA